MGLTVLMLYTFRRSPVMIVIIVIEYRIERTIEISYHPAESKKVYPYSKFQNLSRKQLLAAI